MPPDATRRARAWLLLIVLLASAALAGCSQGPAEQLIASGTLEASERETAARDIAGQGEGDVGGAADGQGGIAGVVVDDAVRPIVGALVFLPSDERQAIAREDGSFRFDGVGPGTHFLRAEARGFLPAEALVEVPEDGVAKVRIVLQAVPDDAPHHVTQAFDGYAEWSDTGRLGHLLYGYALGCSGCYFPFDPEREGLVAMVVEASMAPDPQGENGFETYIKESGDYHGHRFDYALHPNPFRLDLGAAGLSEDRFLEIHVSPTSSPAPETQKAFRVFVTAFYGTPPPPGWSFIAGDFA